MSNLKQLATAFDLYVQDHDETYPPIGYRSEERGGTCFTSVSHMIAPYQKSTGIWRCLTNPSAWDSQEAFLKGLGLPLCSAGRLGLGEISYAFNPSVMQEGQPNPLFLALSGGAFPGDPVTRSAEIEYPAETSLLYDGLLSAPGAACGFADVMIDARHSGAANVTWADSHVKRLKAQVSGQTCTGLDGKPATRYIATEAGPYQGQHTLAGIPVRNADGSWGLK